MDKSASKRKRGTNYTPPELKKFLDLVTEFQSAIDDKSNKTYCLGLKKEAWEKIRDAYNASATTGPRTVDQLKSLYDNVKQKARKIMTAGSEITPFKVTPEDVKTVLEMDKYEYAEERRRRSNLYQPLGGSIDNPSISGDSDTNGNESVAEYLDELNKKLEEIENEASSSTIAHNRITRKPPEILRRNATKRRLRRNFNDYYKQLYFKKLCENADLQKKKIIQEIRLRQEEHRLFKVEHNLKLRIIHVEHEEKFNHYARET